MKISQFDTISDSVELYHRFKDEFFSFITKHIPEDLEFSGQIIDAYLNYDFDRIRIMIDSELENAADILQLNTLNNIIDDVDNQRYRVLKEMDNGFMFFYDKFDELLKLNL